MEITIIQLECIACEEVHYDIDAWTLNGFEIVLINGCAYNFMTCCPTTKVHVYLNVDLTTFDWEQVAQW